MKGGAVPLRAPCGGDWALEDVVLEELWAIRDRIGAGFGNDIHRLGEYYMEFQKQFADRLVPPPQNSGFKPIGRETQEE